MVACLFFFLKVFGFMYTLKVKISKLPVLTNKDKVRGAAVANTDRGWKKE